MWECGNVLCLRVCVSVRVVCELCVWCVCMNVSVYEYVCVCECMRVVCMCEGAGGECSGQRASISESRSFT